MKKILFLLLLSIAGYGQTSTGQEQEFDYGIKNNSTQTITTPTYLTTQGVDGTYGKIPSTYIAKSAAVQDSLNKKLNLPTGFLQGLQLSINADPTKFNIAPGYYVVTDFTNLATPIVKVVTYAGATGLTPAYLATANSTYIALDINGNVISSASPFTNSDLRTLCLVGNVVHSNHSTINVTNEIKAPIIASTNQLHSFMKIFGALNEEGNIYSPTGANLHINKSAGKISALGINPHDYLNPNQLSIPSQTDITFAYRLPNGTQLADTQNLDPNNYSNAGVLTTVPTGNNWTINRFYLFPSGIMRAMHGQAVYGSYADALSALRTENFVVEQNISENSIFRTYVIVKRGTTDLQAAVTAGTCSFHAVDKFNNVIGNSSIALNYTNIIAALGFTPENVANKSDSYTVSSSTTYASTKAIVDGLATKVGGQGVPTQLAFWDGTKTLNGDVNLVWDSTNKKLTGIYQISVARSTNSNSSTQVPLIQASNSLSTQGDGATTFNSSRILLQAGASLVDTRLSSDYDSVFSGATLQTVSAHPFRFGTSFTERMRIHTSGNISIGSTTDDGTNKLQVNGSTKTTALTLTTAPTTSAGTYDILTRNSSTGVVEKVASSIISSKWTQTANDIRNNNTGNVLFGASGNAGYYPASSNFLGVWINGSFSSGSIGIRQNETSTDGISMYLNSEQAFIYGGTGRNMNIGTLKTDGVINASINNVNKTITSNSRFESLVPIKLKNYTVATLPTGAQGDTAYVTDAIAPTYLGTLTGGGSVVCPVFYNGTAWVSH